VRSSVEEFTLINEVVFCCFSQGDLLIYESVLRG
jgi:hypothetical protein